MTDARGLKRLTLALHRRRTAVLMVGGGIVAVGLAIVLAVPAQYRAEAAVKVIDARPPADYVQPSFATPPVSDIVGERMKALRLHILNRPLLVKTAHETGLLADYDGDEEKALDALRDRFEFRVEGADTFTVAFTDRNPDRATQVVNKLAQAFMDDENAEVQGRADSTTKVIEDALKNLRSDLDKADSKIADFKRAHYGSLPEQQDELLRNLEQAQMEVNIMENNVQAAQDRRRHLLELDPSPLRKAEDEVGTRLSAARSQYTDDHPEVQKLREELGRTRQARLNDEERLHQEQLRSPEMLAANGDIARLHGRLMELRKRQQLLRGKVDSVAKNQQSLAALSLDRDVIKDKYTTTQTKLREAQMSATMARDFKPFRFNLIEPAAKPFHAASPNRPLLGLGILALAIVAALGVGLGLELVDPTVRDATDVEQLTPDIPVLAAIPRIDRIRRVK
jgi:protein tyrosine kinase modulator